MDSEKHPEPDRFAERARAGGGNRQDECATGGKKEDMTL